MRSLQNLNPLSSFASIINMDFVIEYLMINKKIIKWKYNHVICTDASIAADIKSFRT